MRTMIEAERLASEERATLDDGGRSVIDLIKELRDEATLLFRQEVALAKTEMSEKAAVLGRNAAYAGVGGFIAYAGAWFLLMGVAFLLAAGLQALGLSALTSIWVSMLVVGVVVGVVGYLLISKAVKAFKQATIVPEKTVESLESLKEIRS